MAKLGHAPVKARLAAPSTLEAAEHLFVPPGGDIRQRPV